MNTWENITLNDLDLVIGGIGQGERWSIVEDGNGSDWYGEELEQEIDYYDMMAKYGTRKVILMNVQNHGILLRAEEA